MGYKPSEEAQRIIAESKALVSPSTCWETFGLAAAEAMSVGTPSVVANLGGLPDIVQDGRFGEVFEAGNAEACAAAIKRLLNRSDYDEMCEAAKREAETKYSEEANYSRLLFIYRDCLLTEEN
jgi:glycosyltransferase involved in cell wall biosynthesis